MKRFLVRISLVLVPFAVLFGALGYVAYYTELEILKRDLICPDGTLAAVVGDSRVEVYFDTAEIPWLRNFGQSGTPFAITAHKARLIAKMNPDLRLLVVDVWPGKFIQPLSKPFKSSAPFGVALIEATTRYDMPPLGEDFETRFLAGVWRPGIKHLLNGGRISHSMITGGFVRNERSLSADISKGRYGPTGPLPKVLEECPEIPTGGEIILEHLLSDLTAQGVNVVLTTTPMLWYEKRYSPRAREYFERRMSEISRRYNVQWYNWMNEYQDRIDYWADGLHLNHIGAKVFSREKQATLRQHVPSPAKH